MSLAESLVRPKTEPTYEFAQKRQLRDLEGPPELPLTLSLNDTAMVTLLATPHELESLALGHAFTAGWIDRADEVLDLRIKRNCSGLGVELVVAAQIAARHARRARRQASVSSCGACGVSDPAQLTTGLEALPGENPLPAAALLRGVATLQSASAQGLHSALGLDEHGNVLQRGSDIGRHNALDRVIGKSLRKNTRPAAVLVSSRCSLELVQKTVRAGIPTLATLSLPSPLAVSTARACSLNLVCCHRGQRLELLSGGV
ncbi:MAG: formate dehydrogenase accessory sulfurtransferase FdhD [Acidihalobacter sp.]